MKTLRVFRSDNEWYIGITVIIILNLRFIVSGTANISSEVEWSGKLRNKTKFKNRFYDVRSESRKPHEGTKKDKILDGKTDNVKTEDKHDENLVFYQTESTRKKEKPKRKTSLLLTSTSNGNNAPHVGDGLDLARASILPRKSSPSIVSSCVGNQVTLKCVAEGNPAPEFTWFKGKAAVGREKVAEFDLTIAPSKFTRASHLTLTPNGKEDFGEYECAASNTLGATQQSTHRIVLSDRGEPKCTQSSYNQDKKKFNSIIIGTVSSAGLLLLLLGIAGFVLWKLNQREADSYQRLKTSTASSETLVNAGEASTSGKNIQTSSNETDDPIQDDFNAKEIGRLSSLLAGDWERLARLLGFHQHDINAIRDDSEKIESRCADMLNKFRRRHGSRETLAESVEEMKDIETATAIRHKYYKSNPIE